MKIYKTFSWLSFMFCHLLVGMNADAIRSLNLPPDIHERMLLVNVWTF